MDTPASQKAPYYGRQMPVTLATAWHNFWHRYATIEGRASRSEFWWMVLVQNLVPWCIQGLALSLIFTGGIIANLTGVDILVPIFYFLSLLVWLAWNLAVIVPSFCLSVRRLHDINRSGWCLLLGFIPLIGQIVLLIFALLPSTPGPNRFGPLPNVE